MRAAGHERGTAMRAKAGDEVVVRRRHFADEDRLGTIVEVHGDNGRQPYLIRWQDGHECLVSHPLHLRRAPPVQSQP